MNDLLQFFQNLGKPIIDPINQWLNPVSIPQPKVFGNPNDMKVTYGRTPNYVNESQFNSQTIPEVSSDPNYRFAFESLKRDPYYATAGARPNFQPTQPPENIGKIIRQFFPNEATPAALVASTENAQFDPKRKDNINLIDGSIDRGIFQINSNTFNGLLQRRGNELKKMGINSFEDMYDPQKNAQVAKMIYDEGSWGRWFGWQNTGYDLNNGYYSQPDRMQYEIKKRGGNYKIK